MRHSDNPLEFNKIMAGGNLDDILVRLHGCEALIWSLCSVVGVDGIAEDAAMAVADLLGYIIKDFQATIDGAEDYPDPEGAAQHDGEQ